MKPKVLTVSLCSEYTRHSLFKSKIEYGVETYGSAYDSNLKKLNPIQNQALRVATGAHRTSPFVSL